MTEKTTATVDLSAVKNNLSVARLAAPQSKVAAVIKADAYGHGILPIAEALRDSDLYAVARLDEAYSLRQAGIEAPILLLSGYISQEELQYAIKLRLQLVIHQPFQLDLLSQSTIPQPVTIWLKLDTGMHRLGLTPNDFIQAYQTLANNPHVAKIITMTHFSSADEVEYGKTTSQLARLRDCHQQLANMISPPVITGFETSTANSAAVLCWPESHVDWVRPGLMLYGVSPVNRSPLNDRLMPAMTFSSHVIAINRIGKGEAVGYNETWISQRPSTIAVIAAGYGDGYPFQAKNGTPVLINGHRVPLVGKVSMDLITVDITDFPDIGIGDQATLWGKELPVNEIATQANTIPYELLTGLTSRVRFHYLDSKTGQHRPKTTAPR